MTQEVILEIKNLITEFQTDESVVRAVDDISMKIHRGETVGIVGESGSGKSVTSLSVMRLIQEPPGKILNGEIIFNSTHFGNTDLLKLSKNEIRKIRGNEIAMIFQEPMTSLNPVYTCGEQVMEAIMLHQKVKSKEAKEKTLELFKKVQLPRPESILRSYPHQISGGQKQRVMIAMAMSCNPKLLIADEPTTALDVTVQSTILDLMRELRDTHDMSIIFITHDLGVIAEIADKVAVMYRGKIVEQGTVYDIFSDPKHPYTKGLLACRPRLDLRLKILPTVADFMKENERGEMVEVPNTVEDAIKAVVVSDEETKARREFLEKQQPLLSIKNLKTFFPIRHGLFGKIQDYVKAVDDVTFDVFPGETLGLVGESGCGKTTLGRTIIRLVEPTEGDIIFKGNRINDLNTDEMREVRKEIQIIFQDPYSSLNPRMTVGEAILEPMKVHGIYENDKIRREKTYELLQKVTLSANHFNRYPHEFSGGQRQRICIARALSLNPKFIICDESVSALDVSVQAQVLNLLNDLRKEFNFTYIFISHDLSVVKFMSDRMLVMNKGQIEEMGYADDIYAYPKTAYTRKLIQAIPVGNLNAIRKAQEKRGIHV
ncbi:MAG: ABC transporter ATP-binding protein [Bacteroidetes bacterium RIFCSPLOWO2_02_FULL_36_8]|nr:MAG: ABC transporter ATP-binding protein [Bacteroidetes bacterium RIFCSPLOWO2_02_FULL_36_8]OFY70384.1 MAG: ABC transporter ATP-binding protein [Bacteroidetes bacterium RIFCSPLOWO2_12_FULL_37_12]